MSQFGIATKTPKPAKLRSKIELIGSDLQVRWRSRSWPVAIFMMFWLTGWTAGCGAMLHQLLTDFEWKMALFVIPFFTAEVVVAGIVVGMLFGSSVLTLSQNELSQQKKAIIVYSQRTVPLDEVAQAVSDTVYESNSDGPGRYVGVVRIETLGDSIEFARGIDEAERDWLAEVFNICLDRLAPNRTAAEQISTRDIDEEPEVEEQDDEEELAEASTGYLLSDQPRERPSDSKVELSRAGRALEFATRGRWSLAAIGGLLFINLFWNGIVSVFVAELVGDFQWFLALFLVPFVGIGLTMFVAFLAVLFAPWMGQMFTIRSGLIQRKIWFLLFSFRKEWTFDQMDRVEIVDSTEKRKDADENPRSLRLLGSGEYALRWIDTNNTEVLTMDNLTKGEALWIADVVMRENPGVFVRRRR